MDFYSEEEIIVTNGASEALDTSLRSIIEPGDEILIPGPIYAGYIPLVETLVVNLFILIPHILTLR